jgi:dienelactone hydrolase
VRRTWRAGAVAGLASVLVAAGCAGKHDPTRATVITGVEYSPGLRLDVYQPVRGIGPLPAVVLLHGDTFADGSRRDMAELASALAYHGYIAISIDYHVTPGTTLPSTGLAVPEIETAEARAQADATTALGWVRANAHEYHIDADRIVIGGFSAGGITAIELATHGRSGVAGVFGVAAAAIDDDAVSQPHPPMLLIRGDLDEVVPTVLVDTTCQDAEPSGGCTLHGIPKIGHDVMTSVFFPDIQASIDQFLGRVVAH